MKLLKFKSHSLQAILVGAMIGIAAMACAKKSNQRAYGPTNYLSGDCSPDVVQDFNNTMNTCYSTQVGVVCEQSMNVFTQKYPGIDCTMGIVGEESSQYVISEIRLRQMRRQGFHGSRHSYNVAHRHHSRR